MPHPAIQSGRDQFMGVQPRFAGLVSLVYAGVCNVVVASSDLMVMV